MKSFREGGRNVPAALMSKDFWKSIAIILLLTLVGYGFLWKPGNTLYSQYSDFIAEHVSTKQVLYDSIHQGWGIPFWRNDQFSGYAGLINPIAQYTYPLHFLFYLLPPLAAVGGTFFLHFLVSALAYYAVGASLGLGFWPRLMMAAAGLFSFKLIVAAYAGWIPNIPVVVCLPLLFAALFYLVKRPSLASSLILAAAGGLCLHSGHMQLLYYAFWFLLAWILIHAARQVRAKNTRALGPLVLFLAISAILAAGISAYLLWPLAAEATLISRSETNYAFFLGGHALEPRQLLTFLFPEALGTPLDGSYQRRELWEDAAYFGLLPLLLAGAGTVLGWRRTYTKYLAVSFAATVFLSMDSPVIHFIYDYLPGFRLFRIPGRFLFLSTFFGIALAGIGLDTLMERMKRKTRGFNPATILAVIIIALISAEGISYAWRYLTMVPYEKAVPHTAYQKFLSDDRSPFRVAPVFRPTVLYGWAAPMGLQLVTGYDSFNYQHYNAYFDLLRWGRIERTAARVWNDLIPAPGPSLPRLTARTDMLDTLNVKYLISPVPLDIPNNRYELAEVFPNQPAFVFYQGERRTDIYLYRNRHFLPRAFWTERVIQADDEEAAIRLIQQHNLSSSAVVEGGIKDIAYPGPQGGDGVEITETRNGHLNIGLNRPTGGYLVISEVWHPGWRASLDGQEVHLYRTNLALLGLPVPPGQHQLMLEFRPLRWIEGLTASIVSGALFVILAIGVLMRVFLNSIGLSHE